MLINKIVGFFIISKKKLANFFRILQPRTRKITVSAKFSQAILKCGKDIHCPKISDQFDYGGSALSNMRIMDHLMSQSLLAFLESFFKLKSPNVVQR